MLTKDMQPSPFPKGLRVKWYRKAADSSVAEACRCYGIPRKTYYKWQAHDFGSVSRAYQPPQEQPARKLTAEVCQFIEATKAKTNYGPAKMALAVQRELGLVVSATVIYRFYCRKHLIRRPQRRLPWYEPLKEPVVITQPGEGVQCDIKYVYEGSRRRYQFSVADPYTRRYFALVFATKHSVNAIAALQAAEAYFGFAIRSVQTDNGGEYRGAFHRWLTEHGLPHCFIPKSSPNWNGIVERIHRTVDEEYYQNPQRAWDSLEEWLAYYNEERIHLSLGGLTPLEVQQLAVTP